MFETAEQRKKRLMEEAAAKARQQAGARTQQAQRQLGGVSANTSVTAGMSAGQKAGFDAQQKLKQQQEQQAQQQKAASIEAAKQKAATEAKAKNDALAAANQQKQMNSSAPSFMDSQMESWIRAQFAGPRDTSEEEALAQRQIDSATGKALVDARARAGAAGFGLSGAATAQEADIRSRAADAALAQTLGIRQGARDEAFRGGSLAAGLFDSEASRRSDLFNQEKNRGLSQQEIDLQKSQFDVQNKALALALEQMGIDPSEFFGDSSTSKDTDGDGVVSASEKAAAEQARHIEKMKEAQAKGKEAEVLGKPEQSYRSGDKKGVLGDSWVDPKTGERWWLAVDSSGKVYRYRSDDNGNPV